MRCDSFRIKRIGGKTYCSGVVLIVMLLLLSLNCRKVDRDINNNQQNAEEWDPRNVSRSPGLSYAPSIAIDNEGSVHLYGLMTHRVTMKYSIPLKSQIVIG